MREIALSPSGVAIVSSEDYEFLSQFKWYRSPWGYAVRIPSRKLGKRKHIFMHRAIMERVLGGPIPEGYETDHINMDKLDNQRVNLRLATGSQNRMNRKRYKGSTSQYKGVHWNKKKKRWQSRITVNEKIRHLGYFINEDDAGRAYDEQARKLFGEYARLNFPDE